MSLFSLQIKHFKFLGDQLWRVCFYGTKRNFVTLFLQREIEIKGPLFVKRNFTKGPPNTTIFVFFDRPLFNSVIFFFFKCQDDYLSLFDYIGQFFKWKNLVVRAFLLSIFFLLFLSQLEIQNMHIFWNIILQYIVICIFFSWKTSS